MRLLSFCVLMFIIISDYLTEVVYGGRLIKRNSGEMDTLRNYQLTTVNYKRLRQGSMFTNKLTSTKIEKHNKILGKMRKVAGFSTQWQKGTVHYHIDKKSYDDIIVNRIHEAMKTIEAGSCVLFKNIHAVPGNRNFTYWLHITNKKNERDCVHRTRPGKRGAVVVVLGFDCMQKRDIIHSLFHALGFRDEVTHPQRDSHVRILWENIQPKYRYLFYIQNKTSPRERLVEYDMMSVMHFHDRAYSINGAATIVPVIPGLLIQPSNSLSQLDKMKLSLTFGKECNRRKYHSMLQTCKKFLFGGAKYYYYSEYENDENVDSYKDNVPDSKKIHPSSQDMANWGDKFGWGKPYENDFQTKSDATEPKNEVPTKHTYDWGEKYGWGTQYQNYENFFDKDKYSTFVDSRISDSKYTYPPPTVVTRHTYDWGEKYGWGNQYQNNYDYFWDKEKYPSYADSRMSYDSKNPRPKTEGYVAYIFGTQDANYDDYWVRAQKKKYLYQQKRKKQQLRKKHQQHLRQQKLKQRKKNLQQSTQNQLRQQNRIQKQINSQQINQQKEQQPKKIRQKGPRQKKKQQQLNKSKIKGTDDSINDLIKTNIQTLPTNRRLRGKRHTIYNP